MNPFMKPLYDEFAGHLYRLFNATIDQVRNVHYETHGTDLDEEFEKIFSTKGSRHLRDEMNWKIIALAVVLEERKTETKMTFDEIGAFAWTLGLNMVVLDETELEAAVSAQEPLKSRSG